MKYAKRILVSCYIFISVFSILSLGGCEHWGRRDDGDNRRHYDEPGERSGNGHSGENQGEHH